MEFGERWRAAWRGLGCSPRMGLLEELLAAYAEPWRAYHTRQHLAECFTVLDSVRGSAHEPAEAELALWFHDAVYDTRRRDNEARSAEWLARELTAAGADAARRERLRALVLATRHSEPAPAGDAELVVDVDLSILGTPPARFDEYERQIRVEYSWVPESEFRAARWQFLERVLARPRIFATEVLAGRFEVAARANLRRSLARG